MIFPSTLPRGAFSLECGSSVNTHRRVRGSRHYPLGRVQSDFYDVVWDFTTAQLHEFWAWFDTIGRGADWFQFEIWDGQALVAQTVRFTDRPAEVNSGFDYWRLPARLECRDRIVMDAAVVDAALGV